MPPRPARIGSRGRAAIALALLLGACASRVAAHDTWLQALDAPAAGLLRLSVSTGTHFPVPDSAPATDGLAGSGCVGRSGRAVTLQPREARPTALLLRARLGADAMASHACWIETRPTRVTLAPADVATYLREVQAPDDVRMRWHDQQQRGVAWRESFVKQARFEHSSDGGKLDVLRVPLSRGLELRVVGGEPPRAGQPLSVQVLQDGQPLAGQSVQLVSERLALGPWRRSDAAGRLEFPALPFGGRWLLRATRIQAGDGADAEWSSRFSTLMIVAR